MELADFPERFRTKVEVDTETNCWLWTAVRTAGGYGQFSFKGKHTTAHRAALILTGRVLPENTHQYVVMHSCSNRACVNPAHLDVGTQRENLLYKTNTTTGTETHCVQGHDRSEYGIVRKDRPGKTCRLCHAVAVEKFREKRGNIT